MPIVSLKEVAKSYRKGREVIDVLDGIDLDIEEGDFLALMGPSGSGKTTLLNLIGGLDSPTMGSVVVGGQTLGDLSGKALARWRSAAGSGPSGRSARWKKPNTFSSRRGTERPVWAAPRTR